VDEQLLLVAGLPGCGKTTYLRELEQEGRRAFDDFKACARNNSPRFRDSRHREALLAAVGEARKCVVADIDFCRSEARTEADLVLREDAPAVRSAWRFFENSPERCEVNIRRRNRPSLETDLRKMRQYSIVYQIPDGAQVLPVLHV
jgi:hypothetical protein